MKKFAEEVQGLITDVSDEERQDGEDPNVNLTSGTTKYVQ